MELVVLLKAVPRSETVRYDPTQRTLVRDGVELVLGPLDQRALRVALELRRPGESVTVVALGPPPVAPLLREARAVGADRSWHLCDVAFAGSDVLATATGLAAALHRARPALVLAGARSTDGDTGLVAPEVAARLGIPVVSGARAIRRRERPSALEVEVETETGWATVEVDLPAVVTVGEKIGKPLAATPQQFAEVGEAGGERFDAAALGLSPAEVGGFGSPTSVVEVRAATPARLGRTFADGSPGERAARAVEELGTRLGGPSVPPAPLPWPAGPDPSREVVVLATDRRGAADPEALGVVTLLRRELPAHTLLGATYGPPLDLPGRRRLEAAGALGGYQLDPRGSLFDSGDVARGLSALVDLRPKLAVLALPATPFGREVAGRFAATRSLGVVADAVGVRAADDGTLDWSKPSFGGNTVATVRCRSRPTVVTVPRGLATPATDGRYDDGVGWTTVEPPRPEGRVRVAAERPEAGEGAEPEGAEVVVAVGSGVGGAEGIARILPVVGRWGAALVGTRRVVDAGWLPARRQVGLTGRAFAPRLAVLLGVRGALNHMVGWGRARAILAVNRDADAPVFRAADVGIVGTVEEVVPALTEPLAQLLARFRPS